MTDTPRVIIHATGSTFVETYITVCDLHRGLFSQLTDDEIFMMVAKAQVGAGIPFWEVDVAAIAAAYDPATRAAWVIDPDSLGEPTGYGEQKSV